VIHSRSWAASLILMLYFSAYASFRDWNPDPEIYVSVAHALHWESPDLAFPARR
jgi:hypothetical protein